MGNIKRDNKNKRKKKRKIIGILKMLFFVVLLVFGLNFVFFTDFFEVKNIEFPEFQKIDKETLMVSSGLKLGENIILIKKKEAALNLKKLGYIKDVSIIRVFPDTIKIYITEREPEFIIKNERKFVYADEEGAVAEISDQVKRLNIPLVTGLDGILSDPKESEKIKTDPLWVGNNLVTSISLLKQYELTGKISEIYVTNEKQLHIYTNGGSIIKVKDKENLESKIDFIYTYINDNDDRMIIDLTHGGNPTYTPR
ncbi:cell division protein FtsQ/DivIB [Alkalibacter mobilis]|uniref:cell division protein FtsQ/DivIB n=1 Tax=Alkalibacter mobilis TaxID=2787712 RepID=UPI0018A0BF3B|nr:FtsQ-type POTRA domain-containing protein [Alkalibacter mobilis]MBF7097131.1 FtsQ-type POTRA domain-containing protein [Alkalibacter mobilis]